MKWEHPKDDRTALRLVAFFLGLCAAGYLAYLALPNQVPQPKNPSIWATVVDNRWFLEGIRVVIIIAGFYIVISMLSLARDGTWLTTFGPVSAQLREKTAEISKQDFEYLTKELDLAREVAKTETRKTAETTALLNEALARIRLPE